MAGVLIFINGTINSGKSTVASLLSKEIPSSVYKVITLAPSEETALSKRGDRILTENEKQRISQMYLEGYHKRTFSDLIIKNDFVSAEDTVKKIRVFLITYLQM